MIQVLDGTLIKAPEESQYQNVEGRTAINFTVVENRNRRKDTDPQFSTFYNVTVLASSEKQADFFKNQPKGKGVVFTSLTMQSLKEGEKQSDGSQRNNVNLNASSVNFLGSNDQESGDKTLSPAPRPNNSSNSRGGRVTPARQAQVDDEELEDPFADN